MTLYIMRYKMVITGVVVALLASCASVSTEKAAAVRADNAVRDEPFPPYGGPKQRVQILRFGVPQEIADRYPELAEKRVGWGLYNTVIDELYATGRFEFVEEKASIRERIMQNWALSQSGLVVEEQQIDESSGMALPNYLVYAEVFDFSVSTSEKIVGIASEKVATSLIGIQMRMVDVATGEYVPSSGNGEASTTAKMVWITADQSFDQSTVGLATKRAVHAAVLSLVKKMEQ
jgi:curli biogenesis system outer membrane secretion channel CsgG